jgi:ABC-2 type transport system permease protein
MKQIIALTRKELNSYFSSPMALIFVGVFLAVTLFTFFWVDEFFARGIADLRPMFKWMPTLTIFLAAALTMRQWSEEQQNGTLEILLTLPMKLYQLVLGKFLAVLILVVVALLLTLFLPISISFFGNPDFGPIVGGYLATVLMASAYIAIGLFVSSRTGNQIVSLILTVLVCGLFQLVGSAQITDLFSASSAEILRGIGTSSRFESIERGVIDLRDLIYYLSLTVVFLLLNVFSLDTKRWGTGLSTRLRRFNSRAAVSLVTANLLILNVLIFPYHSARVDLTQDQEYSLSDVTRDLLNSLQEPLLIRGYFSEKNHPLLSPLIPYIRDVLEEYRIASDNKVEVEIIDPIEEPEKENEANQVYGISSTPLQTSDRYGASVINIYFDILIRYGDQNVVLNFRDLIEVNQYGDEVEVRLRNLEYDLTRSIKKVVYGFQSVDAVLAALDQPAQLTLYYTPGTLPSALTDAPTTIQQVADKIASTSDGKFTFQSIDVSDSANGIDSQTLYDRYGIQPIAAGFLSSDTYYMHMVLQAGNKIQVIYPPNDISETGIRGEIESALQRAAPGFLKVVGVWTPPETPTQDMFGQTQSPLQTYRTVTQALQDTYEVQTVDLSTGEVPASVDILLVIGPENLTDVQRYAVDQYLMRGGTVFVAGGNYKLSVDQMSGMLTLQPIEGGLSDMLASYGITVDQSVVLDPQNLPFPITVTRNAGGFQVQEIQALDYPFFVDIRTDGMDRNNPIMGQLPALMTAWASPITVDKDKNSGRKVTTLFKSSKDSWATTDTTIEPNMTLYPETGFPVGSDKKSYPLGVVVEGSFESYFKGKPSPFEATTTDETQTDPNALPTVTAPSTGLIESSPNSARLIVVGSGEFLNDTVFQITSNLSQDSYLNNLQFVQNAVDWATEDTDLLSIRSRGTTTRVLDPLTDKEETKWEVLNYVIALISLVVLGGVWQWRKRAAQPMPLVLVESESGANG